MFIWMTHIGAPLSLEGIKKKYVFGSKMKIYDLSQEGKACFFTLSWKVGQSRAMDQRDVDDTLAS